MKQEATAKKLKLPTATECGRASTPDVVVHLRYDIVNTSEGLARRTRKEEQPQYNCLGILNNSLNIFLANIKTKRQSSLY